MKKYKVLTDNLDWFGIQKGAELVFADDLKIRVHNILEGGINPACWNVSDDDEFKIKMLLSRHPDWFQEVKEEKPPLGIIPRYLYVEQRINDIQEAKLRFLDSGKEIPLEWEVELKELLKTKLNYPFEVFLKGCGYETNHNYKEFIKEDMIDFGQFVLLYQRRGSTASKPDLFCIEEVFEKWQEEHQE